MSLSISDFIAHQERKLKAFEADWMANHKINPDIYPLEMEDGNEGSWDEQLDCFVSDD